MSYISAFPALVALLVALLVAAVVAVTFWPYSPAVQPVRHDCDCSAQLATR